MRYRLACLLVLLAGPALAADAGSSLSLTNPMIADISQNAIEIHANFNGTQLLIFGAQNIPGDLVIVVRGPESKILMRRKERIAGMWMHVEQHKYDNVPLFYALAATRPLAEIASAPALAALGLGEEQVARAGTSKPNTPFDGAMIASLNGKRWWQKDFSPITHFGESLFKARLDLPDTLPGGTYTAEVYLFDHDQLQAVQTIPLTVSKTGIEAQLYEAAQNHELYYGIAAVLIALFGGWLAHRLFHRR